MKLTQTPQIGLEAPARVEFQVQFSGGPKGPRRPHEETVAPSAQHQAPAAGTTAPKPAQEVSFGRLPKVTQLVVLGHYFEKLVREGIVKNYAGIARLTGLSRARVTQISNLTLLAPEIQEKILDMSPARNLQGQITEHLGRILVSEPNWRKQLGSFSPSPCI